MKFGKKKSKESAQDQTPEQSPVEQSSKSQEPVAKRGRRLGSVALQQALAVLLAGVVAVLAVYFLSVMPAAEKRHEASRQVEADSAQQRLNQYFTAQQEQVQAIANQPHVLRGLAGDTGTEALASQLQTALPGASSVFVFPMVISRGLVITAPCWGLPVLSWLVGPKKVCRCSQTPSPMVSGISSLLRRSESGEQCGRRNRTGCL